MRVRCNRIHTHMCNHTLSLSLSLSLYPFLYHSIPISFSRSICISLCFSLPHIHTHTYVHTITHTLIQSKNKTPKMSFKYVECITASLIFSPLFGSLTKSFLTEYFFEQHSLARLLFTKKVEQYWSVFCCMLYYSQKKSSNTVLLDFFRQ